MKKTLLIVALLATGLFANPVANMATEAAKSEAGKAIDSAVAKITPTEEKAKEENKTKEVATEAPAKEETK